MKKCIPVFAALLLSCSLLAQYKKASFFSKTGRTYEAGAQLHAFGKGLGNPVGYKIGFGSDRDGKQFFLSWELQLIPSYKYSYITTDYNSDPVIINGTTKPALIYSIHCSYHLLKNNNEQRIIKPFVTGGLVLALTGGIKSETHSPESYDFNVQTDDESFHSGIDGGLGTLINFSSSLGLKLQGGYIYVIRPNTIFPYWNSGIEQYYLFPSHPYLSLSLQIRIVSDN